MFGKPLEYDSYEVDFNIEVDNPSDEFEDILLNSQKVWDEDDFKHLPTTGRSDEAYVNEEKDVEV